MIRVPLLFFLWEPSMDGGMGSCKFGIAFEKRMVLQKTNNFFALFVQEKELLCFHYTISLSNVV